MLTQKKKKNCEKLENATFEKFRKKSWCMAQGKQELKFERNRHLRFRDNCSMDKRQMMDRQQRNLIS